MASLHKMVYTLWIDQSGKKVPAGTPGAKRVKRKSAKWYACCGMRAANRSVCRSPPTRASQALLADLLRNKDAPLPA